MARSIQCCFVRRLYGGAPRETGCVFRNTSGTCLGRLGVKLRYFRGWRQCSGHAGGNVGIIWGSLVEVLAAPFLGQGGAQAQDISHNLYIHIHIQFYIYILYMYIYIYIFVFCIVCLLFRNRLQRTQRTKRQKNRDRSKSGPGAVQERPRAAGTPTQAASEAAATATATTAPQRLQDVSKTPSRRLQDAPRGLQGPRLQKARKTNGFQRFQSRAKSLSRGL
jgi:hypothetical protein